LRFGEATELRRGDIELTRVAKGKGDPDRCVLHVQRGVTVVRGQGYVIGTPKSDAGSRDVTMPPHLIPMIRAHLAEHVALGPNALLFYAVNDRDAHLASSTWAKSWYPARLAAGRPDLRTHDLRHTGAVFAALSGATLAELMGRLGHSTAGAALRYQHVAEDRDAVLAEALSKLANADVVPIRADAL
jgi:integrase